MPLPVKLKDVVNEMDVLGDEWTAYLNRKTGELIHHHRRGGERGRGLRRR